MIINRLNNNGSENLDWWFGEQDINPTSINQTNIEIIEKPQYVQYTMKNLKKRSTKRLVKMYYNMFGKTAPRDAMIIDLFRKLNQLWNLYADANSSIKTQIDQYGYEFIDIGIVPGFIYPPKKRGRKVKFEKRHCWAIIADYEIGKLNLVNTATKWDTNIATVSNIINGKGTYKNLFEVDI